jgi:hypothetical protein
LISITLLAHLLIGFSAPPNGAYKPHAKEDHTGTSFFPFAELAKRVPYLWHTWDNARMKQDSIRTTVDIPAPLYRRLKAQAAANGRSVRELVLAGVQSVLLRARRPRRKRVQFPLIVSSGPKVDLTNEQIYEHVEFP